ncbi:MAG: PQQ-binding-like beta-propeller repeat protein [Bacteroidales bacterium]|nr:PQQ-binding-like beta-propeller repeat protein [Bacteroidales bacterium]
MLNLGAILSTPVIDDDIIYFADSNGYVYALRLE